MIVDSASIVDCLGDNLDYLTAMKSFSPFYSDIGLGFSEESGIQTLYLHYNRGTKEFTNPFLVMPEKSKAHNSTAVCVKQFFEQGQAGIAFCGHNTWVIECDGIDSLEFGIPADSECTQVRCSEYDETTRLFNCYMPTKDKRDPDLEYPVILGLRISTGSLQSGDGIEQNLKIEADKNGRMVIAFSARMLAIDPDTIISRLDNASPNVDDAIKRTQQWYQQAMGPLKLETENEREGNILARCVQTLLGNSTEAPGILEGRISAFPSRGTYPTHFLWDSCFQNLATELMDPQLAEDSLLLLTENLRADGKMAHFLCSTWMRPHHSQPPLVGWAGLRLVKARNDLDLAAKLLPALQHNTRWWLSQRMTKFGLITAKGALETGWDDSPRLDDGPTVAADMNTYLLLQMRACAEFAKMLGDEETYTKQVAEADAFAQCMVDVMFDETTNLFWDLNPETGEPVKIKTPACFLPLLGNVPIPEEAKMDAIQNVLLNPDYFYGKVLFPTVAYDEDCYQPEQWWRGPTWMPVAYLMVLVLDNGGLEAEAADARRKLYDMLIADGEIRELFNSQTGEGMGSYEQGWTAAICLALHEEIKSTAALS